MFFEGPEKKVELVVAPDTGSLRLLGREVWEEVVQKAGAKILSEMSNNHCDAYLLSESSLFVFETKFILITCGKTLLTPAIHQFLRHVPTESVEMLFYERKNEMFPHAQRSGFLEEAAGLHQSLPGKAYQFGDADSHHVNIFHLDKRHEPKSSDTTIEILMHGLGENALSLFCEGQNGGGDLAIKRSGVRDVLEGYTLDDRLFSPAGYSLNAIKDESYYTIHVSPGTIGSYASFETNHDINIEGGSGLIKKAIDIFSPSSFDIVYYTPKNEESIMLKNKEYELNKSVSQNLVCGYKVFFESYYKPSRVTEQAVELPLVTGVQREI